MDPWPMIEADRVVVADYLSGLSDDDWATPSLCTGWSVVDVAAHLLVVPTTSAAKVFATFVSSGFSLARFSDKMVSRITADKSAGEIVSTMRATASSRNTPPGLKPLGVLAEVLVHAGDISVPLGRSPALPAEHYVVALDFLKEVQPALGCKQRIAGLRLSATDAEWSHGDGPFVEGTVQDLALAMTGRVAALERLEGPGVETIRARP